ncbi:MAG: sigma-70 family RNA polymerase sigma factor [Tannerella sp.]|jgi:RNA polymerase sigma factor (sigma-70 family)|nr:sigma-70 family RNA polymerase sigma factor [Tannerella sp.]
MNTVIDAIYRMYVHDLFSYARHLGFEREVAMDAIHDVFYKLCLDKNRLSQVTNIRFYLLRALKNRLLNISDHERETVGLSAGETADERPFTIHVTVEDIMIQAEEDRQIRSKVEKLLAMLTDRQREIIYLRYMQECEYEEIARIMHITVPACRKLLHKAMMKLREKR